jgi:hypothetical protein
MKILLSGSYTFRAENYSELLLPAFKKACGQLGQAFVSQGHTVITSTSISTEYEYADRYVLEGIENWLDGARKARVEVYAPEGATLADQLRTIACEPGEAMGEFINRYKKLGPLVQPIPFQMNWQTGQAAAVSHSDVVIVVGGGEGAATIIALAAAMTKPVIGVPQFGGIGQKYFTAVNRTQMDTMRFSDETKKVIEFWTDNSSLAYITFAERLRKKSGTAVLLPAYIGIAILAVVLCCIWAVLYQRGFSTGHWLRLIPLSCCAGLLGWALSFGHNMADYVQQYSDTNNSPLVERAVKEFLTVLILSVIYGFLACEASGFYGTSIDHLHSDNLEELARGISIIAAGVGLLSAEAYTRLRKRLSGAGIG